MSSCSSRSFAVYRMTNIKIAVDVMTNRCLNTCAVLCCAVLCCAVLCCAVLCCAVLCCAVLSYVNTMPIVVLMHFKHSHQPSLSKICRSCSIQRRDTSSMHTKRVLVFDGYYYLMRIVYTTCALPSFDAVQPCICQLSHDLAASTYQQEYQAQNDPTHHTSNGNVHGQQHRLCLLTNTLHADPPCNSKVNGFRTNMWFTCMVTSST